MGDPAYERLAQAALDAATTLLPQWMGGKRVGNEWVGERRANGGIGDSWSVNLRTGIWSCFADGRTGRDLISLYAAIHHINQGPAKSAIERQLGVNDRDIPVLPTRPAARPPSPSEPIPEDAPPIERHPHLGPPTREYRYGNAFVVTRFDYVKDGEPQKTFAQWTWRNGHWSPKGYGGNAPLFHVEQLRKYPEVNVIVVEGEKCVEALQPVLDAFVVTTWAGGSYAVDKSDWSLLTGRDVIIWPDADEPGRKAASRIAERLHGVAKRVRVLQPNGQAQGWDAADAIQEGWDRARISQYIKDHVGESIVAPEPAPAVLRESGAPPRQEPRPTPTRSITISEPPELDDSALVSWGSLGLDCNGNQIPHPTLANASKILQLYRNFKGHIWYDEFRGNVYHTLRGPAPQPWTDRDTRQVTVAIQQQLRLPKFTLGLVRDAITHAAECHSRNSLTDWLDSLTWDGIERLNTWLADCAGVELTDYTQAVSRNWPIAMVARAYQPGCKMDNIPVLEGVSGLNKTQFLEVLGGEWYEALPMEFGTKDFLQTLQGVWLAEIPDMTGFERSDHSRVISMLSIPRDKYRKAYGYTPERYLRTTIFAATSEDDDYLLDRRGKRRFWPIRCTDINLDSLRQQRDNLFAEAVIRYRAGESWYRMPASAAEEQESRLVEDTWVRLIMEYANSRWDQLMRIGNPPQLTLTEILVDGLKLASDRQTSGVCRRAAAILRANGWVSKRTTKGSYWRKLERPTGNLPRDDS